jgi:hypothetical protein
LIGGAKTILIIRQMIESILLVGGIYILSSKKLDKKAIYVGIIHGIIVNVIRLLPISFGVHSVLSLTGLIYMVSQISNINIINIISNGIILFLILSICDWIALGLYTNLFKLSIEQLLNGGVVSSLYSMGPLVTIAIMLFLIKFIRERRKNGFNT